MPSYTHFLLIYYMDQITPPPHLNFLYCKMEIIYCSFGRFEDKKTQYA